VSRPYPVLLELDGAPVLVVGGGVVAARRAAALVEAGGRPVVIARTP
jgi:uroporphyrin-III C-methyltransferase/precorrin-2 dehydrogenase/sirohydrochlorin ferrochelatase